MIHCGEKNLETYRSNIDMKRDDMLVYKYRYVRYIVTTPDSRCRRRAFARILLLYGRSSSVAHVDVCVRLAYTSALVPVIVRTTPPVTYGNYTHVDVDHLSFVCPYIPW